MEKFIGKRGIGIILAIIILVATYFMPATETLSHEGVMGLGVLGAAVVMWVCMSFPIGVTGMLVLAAGAVMGVMPVGQIFAGFGSSTALFITTVFALTFIFQKSGLSKRLCGFVSRWAGENSRKLVLGVMAVTALTSTIMTDTATIILYFGLSVALLESLEISKKSNLAKCLYIGVPFAGITGGFGTPAGNATNVLASSMMEAQTGQAESFLGWMIVAMPIVIVVVLVCWICLITLFKPEKLNPERAKIVYDEAKSLGRFSAQEIKTLILILVVPILWILSTWVPVLSTTAVCVLAFGVMLAPGMNLLTFGEYQKAVPWNLVFMCGTVMSLGTILGATGGAAFMGNLVLSTGVGDLNIYLSLILVGLALYLLHTFLPIGPGFFPIFFAPMIAICASAGVNPMATAVMLACITGGNFLFPINPTNTITFDNVTYKISDMVKAGVVPVLVLIIVMAFWIPFISDILVNAGILTSGV
jgi:sodium-dependent dicarboxylate transporter 2/3/5